MLLRSIVASLALLSSSNVLAAESAQLKIPDFSHLSSRAVESVDITVGPFLLALASTFALESDEEGKKAKEILKGIEAVYVRSYQFAEDNVYSRDDIDKVRQQLQADQWKPIAEIRNKKNAENVDIFIALKDDKPIGFAILASEPREFTIVNVVGTIDIAHIATLQAGLGLPGAGGRVATMHHEHD
jgi:Domain of unknown function (DUF4252)